MRHNELRDLFGELLTEVCRDVRVEPCLQSLSGEVFSSRSANTAPDASADMRARGFWTRGEDAFFDVRVFHPNAPSHVDCSPTSLFSRHERFKRLEYEQRIVNIERRSFTLVVLATTGACGPAADCFIKWLAGHLAEHDRHCRRLALDSDCLHTGAECNSLPPWRPVCKALTSFRDPRSGNCGS